MKIAILGYGEQGRSAYDYWRSGNEITICDAQSDLALPDNVELQLGPDHLKGLERFDLIVRSPIVHPAHIVAANSSAILDKVTTNTNEFLRICPTKNIIGVTGTKGKGTTTTLIAHMLEAAGKKVHLGGNIGTPPLDLLNNHIGPRDWVVLELANFQLIDLKYSPPLAVCLMVVAEHLDWHKDVEEYITAKKQLFRWQQPEDTAIFYAANDYSKAIAGAGKARQVPYFVPPGAIVQANQIVIADTPICPVSDIKLLGAHNLQNVCAAVTTVWQITQDVSALQTVLRCFGGLEHRLELVARINGADYYDDSFATTPETAIVAMEAFDRPKVIILGGSDKGADYAGLAKSLTVQNIRKVILIGEQGERLQAALEATGFHDFMREHGVTMPAIVATACAQAHPGDVVLLSPACASFDLFKNYKDRGEQFKQVVQALSRAAGQ